MSKYQDSVGHLNDLANEINEPWFQMVSDLASVSGVSTLDRETGSKLFEVYTNPNAYAGVALAVSAPTPTAALNPIDFLESLSNFRNFKLLGESLEAKFEKRVTLIFGANGSGKSSLCESLKVLATRERPIRPLQNVRQPSLLDPEFHFKFKSDLAPQPWTKATGFGPRSDTVKYFDTAIALRNVKDPIEPGIVVELTPFKLHLFEWVTSLTSQFRETLQVLLESSLEKKSKALEIIRGEFTEFVGSPLATLGEPVSFSLVVTDETTRILLEQIKIGEAFSDQLFLKDKQTAADELEKATSEEGFRLLRAEHHELDAFLASVRTLLDSASELWAREPARTAKTLVDKTLAQEILATALIPTGGTLQSLLTLLRAASPLCAFDHPDGHTCPLCRRGLGISEVELFKRYHDLLTGEIESEIISLQDEIRATAIFANTAHAVDRTAWDKYTTIEPGIIEAAKQDAQFIVEYCDNVREPSEEARLAFESLTGCVATLTPKLEAMVSAITVATSGRTELVKRLNQIREEMAPLRYAQSVNLQLELINDALTSSKEVDYFTISISKFPPLLKKITDKAKEAHRDLVVSDFEARLNAEYEALTEKSMAEFGVRLNRKGTDATVTVLPQIGGTEIDAILSEGEQRVHALALFFAELETCSQSVLVFDDPISSFDFNYSDRFCTRLRDFALSHPDRQMIVLTHSWECFGQLQRTFNKAHLDKDISVKVLEMCSTISAYSERIDELRKSIEDVLNTPGEPTRAQKESLAGNMRRLIEAVVNTHVFNGQRYQFKEKKPEISAFEKLTKVTPLEMNEALSFVDLYASLSITEHDDPKSCYVRTDKAVFQNRYRKILAIEDAIRVRKP